MLILRSRRKYMVFTTLICSIALLMVTAVPAQAVVPYFWPNVLGTKTQNNYGAYSFIRVSNPTIRPGVNAWVYHRALGRRIQADYGDTYIESGFTKNADTNQVMHFWVWADRNGATGWGTANHLGFPVVGQAYDYKVERTGSKTYGAFVGPNRVLNRWLGWDVMWEWASGLEVGNTNQGSGDTNHGWVQVRGTDNVWRDTCGYEVYNSHVAIYTLWGAQNCYSWRIFGNG
jgi:hypothetical protein